MALKDYVEIIHNDPNITTLQGFVDEYLINIGQAPINTLDDLLNYDGNSGRILDNYRYNDPDTATASVLRVGTKIRVPKGNIERSVIDVLGNFIIPNDGFNAYLDDRQRDLLTNERYQVVKNQGTQKEIGKAYKIPNECTVFIYCKALGSGKAGRLINVTPFLINATTSVSKNAGGFTLELAPVMCEYRENIGWVIPAETLKEYGFQGRKNFVVRDSVIENKKGVWKRKKTFFHHLISSNDVVFIQFEKLEIESENRPSDILSTPDLIYPDVNNIVGRVWDMIGLVDTNSQDYSPQNANFTISIQGRDFMKTLLDDGCYVYPIDFARGFEKYNQQQINRVLAKDLYFFRAFVDTPLSYLITFLVNQLSNIGVVRSPELFDAYGSRKSYKYEFEVNIDNGTVVDENLRLDDIDKAEPKKIEGIKKVEAEGIWKIIKLVVDEKVAPLRVVDKSITDFQGSLIQYVRKICQEPFVEFFGDTYGDEYYFILRRPPYTKQAYLSNFDNTGQLEINEEDIYTERLQFDDGQVFTWYRLNPQGSGMQKGLSDTYASELTVFLPEYAEIWGARAFDQVTNFADIHGKNERDAITEQELLQQLYQDLRFMVESYCYLPFTRRGTIQIKGDRRFKIGQVIRHTGTGELFHIDGVSHSYYVSQDSTDRITELQVSRGMVEDYARGVNIDGVKYSYFTLVDLEKSPFGNTEESLKAFKVIPEVFEFFLKQKQFS